MKCKWQVWRNIRYDNHTIDCTPLYLRKLWAVKCNEQAERQLSMAKPQYGKLSIVRGKRSVVLEHGYHGTVRWKGWNGIGGMICVKIGCAGIIRLWKSGLAWL